MKIRHLFIALVMLALPASAQVSVGFGGEAHDAQQPVEITSDSLSLDQENGNAVFSGNVLVIQGNLRMAAGEITVLYSTQENGQGVQRVIASGGVLVTRGADAAEGESADYAVDDALLTLNGNVLITQGATAISGDRLVVNMDTGSGTVSGRVRTVLQSDNQ